MLFGQVRRLRGRHLRAIDCTPTRLTNRHCEGPLGYSYLDDGQLKNGAPSRMWAKRFGFANEASTQRCTYGGQRIALHSRAERRRQVITHPPHHEGIPLGNAHGGGKILIQTREVAPSMEVR
jgi:hypothetical protein